MFEFQFFFILHNITFYNKQTNYIVTLIYVTFLSKFGSAYFERIV